MTSKETFLSRVRAAVPRGKAGGLRARHAAPAIDPMASQPRAELWQRFALELRALGGTFDVLPEVEITAAVLNRLSGLSGQIGLEHGYPPVLIWQSEGLPVSLIDRLRRERVEVLGPILPTAEPERGARLAELARAGMGVTGAAAAIAETGSLVLRHGPGRGRLASLLPPVHVAILRADQVHPTLESFLETSRADPLASASALTLVTGPSRTADIEMTLTIGVHGPKEVAVYVVAED